MDSIEKEKKKEATNQLAHDPEITGLYPADVIPGTFFHLRQSLSSFR